MTWPIRPSTLNERNGEKGTISHLLQNIKILADKNHIQNTETLSLITDILKL